VKRAGPGRFTTITSEGGLLSLELLDRISERDATVAGLRPADYHLAAGERLGEMATRAWNRLAAAWKSFQASLATLPPEDPATTITRERWLSILFSELGYGRLQASPALDIGGKSYPISHVWQSVPIHLVGARIELDRRTPGVRGAAGASPHSLVQELLNRSDQYLWGMVSNGKRVRLLRDNASLVRTAYVDFDLESMMADEVFSDFVVLWLVCHESRLEGDEPERCWLERWRTEAIAAGTRALDALRGSVEKAIEALGAGFLARRGNTALHSRLRSGELSTLEYYRQVLRLVYRLIFLFVAEDRDLLLDPDADSGAARRYMTYYSTQRLRDVAGRHRGSVHPDLWCGLRVVFSSLRGGQPSLGLPALGSFLFSKAACPDLDNAMIANDDLLAALRHLAFTQVDRHKSVVDFRNLGTEELGSVYESLLEQHPHLDVGAAAFGLTTAPGHERKTTGSYYTPSSLVSALLDSTVDPVLDRVGTGPEAESAILGLRVLDPACGSGHFLIAAAHRIARRLASVRTGEAEPSPEAVQHALRDVIGHCIHGIDANPMAVELCKISLWMEALEPGKPLSFLEHRIVCGNAILGAMPALVEAGIPDSAFVPLTGDDKATVSNLKKANRQHGKGGQQLLALDPSGNPYRPLAQAVEEIDALPDDTVAHIANKEHRWEQLQDSLDATYARLVADAWCAAFVIEKTAGAPRMTEGEFQLLRSSPEAIPRSTLVAIEKCRRTYGFLHWHLAFPHVFRFPGPGEEPGNAVAGWSGGFDLVIGNPPWERVKLAQKEFFAARAPQIVQAAGAKRRAMIAALTVDDPDLFEAYQDALRQADGASHLLRDSGRFPLCGRGDVNTYAIFAEAVRSVLSPRGRAGIIVPTGIATDDTTKVFFADLMACGSLVSLLGFYDRKRLFTSADVHSFCLLTIAGKDTSMLSAEFCFFARDVGDLSDFSRRFSLSCDDLALLNPNTKTCPVFRSRRDAEITKRIYERVPVLIRDDSAQGNPWDVRLSTMFHMTNDSGLFRSAAECEAEGAVLDGNVYRAPDGRVWMPLYEGKMVHHFDHRWAGVTAGEEFADCTPTAKADALFAPLPRYWVRATEVDQRLGNQGWLLGFRDIARATDERTVIAAVIPRTAVGNKLPLLLSQLPPQWRALLGASMASFVHDFSARQKIGGTTLNFFLVEQFPVLPPSTYDRPAPWDAGATLAAWLTPRILELTYTAWDLAGFAADLCYRGRPFRWDDKRRALLRSEIDACFFHLYGLDRDEVEYVMSTFPIVRRRDEAAHGEHRTARFILERYDAMTKAAEGGDPYQSPLDPEPASPLVADQKQRE
jgi:hypothetical protein